MKHWTDPTNLRAKDLRHAAIVLACMALLWMVGAAILGWRP